MHFDAISRCGCSIYVFRVRGTFGLEKSNRLFLIIDHHKIIMIRLVSIESIPCLSLSLGGVQRGKKERPTSQPIVSGWFVCLFYGNWRESD